ncbi:DUF6020 family protein [Butyrivibrio sp. VCB2006]|uniref:DUF6020 family protein n=1 Tax=Butyrivibrio sp. VCB2006 TaxID=1280679 RepID=UPI0012DEEC73|nr:DUF6020 family protein [Butyrivibrio sp. VCB2006]
MQKISGITVRNPLTVVFFVLLLYLSIIQDKQRALGNWISVALSATTTLLFRNRITAAFDNRLFQILSLAIVFVGLCCVFYICFGFPITIIRGEKRTNAGREIQKLFLNTKPAFGGTRAVLIIAAICFLFWLPYFLYEYPGIMTADSLVQYAQFAGDEPVSNHHPIIHTLLIKLFHDIAMGITGNPQIGIACYTLFQMIFMAVCCGILICHIRSRKLQIIALLFYALVPFNAVFMVTVWKDIICAGLTMLLLCCVIDLRQRQELSIRLWVHFVILSILFSLFRSNAWYAFLAWVPFLLIAVRKNIKRAVCSVAIIILVVVALKGPVMTSAGVAQPDLVESLSVPVQQIARMMVDDRKLDEEDLKLIEEVIDTTYIRELYAADFADNIKELVRAGHPEKIEENKFEYFKLWFRINAENPGTSVRAWYDLNGGYINPDVSIKVGEIDGIMNNEFGLFWDPKIGGKLVVKGKEIALKLGDFVPLYGMLWSIGTYTWLLIIATGVCIYKKRPILGKVLLLFQVGTLLIAAPVVDFRYGYGIVMTMPLWLLYNWGKETEYATAD